MVEIKGYLPTSLIDYPGKIVSVVFLPRCNFSCPYCFNVEMVKDDKKLNKIPEENIIEHLKSRKKWLDGVCITGGEPTLQKGLPDFIKKIKELGFLVKLDTNGTNPEMLAQLLKEKLIDYIAMDVKGPLGKYPQIAKTDAGLEGVKKSVELIKKSGVDYEFRTTVSPALLSKKDIEEMGKWLKGVKKLCLQQIRTEKMLDEKFSKKAYTPDELKKLAEVARPFFKSVEVRGI